MVKGCETRVVRLKNPESKVFEEVLFVLKEGGTSPMAKRDIVAEANRILEESSSRPSRRVGSLRGMFPFFLGAVSATLALLPLLLR